MAAKFMVRPEHFHAAAIPLILGWGSAELCSRRMDSRLVTGFPQKRSRPRGYFCACRNVRTKHTKHTKSGSGSHFCQ